MLALAVLSSALLLAFAFGAVGSTLLHAAPLVLIALPLLGGRFMGEDAIKRFATRRGGRPTRVVVTPMAISAHGSSGAVARARLLLAASLVVRGPPASASTR